MFDLITKTDMKYPESNGYYERVPIRVSQFTLLENNEDAVVFETTDEELCDGGPKIRIKITNTKSGWVVRAIQGSLMWDIVPSVELSCERTERRRAFWHAGQYMKGNDLDYKQRFTISRRIED